jgi:hypothetical protein
MIASTGSIANKMARVTGALMTQGVYRHPAATTGAAVPDT